MDYTGIAALITALAVLIAACGSIYISIRTTRTVKQTHGMVTQIDRAVNGQPPGGQTMVSQVADLHKEIPESGPDSIRALLAKLIIDVDELKKAKE